MTSPVGVGFGRNGLTPVHLRRLHHISRPFQVSLTPPNTRPSWCEPTSLHSSVCGSRDVARPHHVAGGAAAVGAGFPPACLGLAAEAKAGNLWPLLAVQKHVGRLQVAVHHGWFRRLQCLHAKTSEWPRLSTTPAAKNAILLAVFQATKEEGKFCGWSELTSMPCAIPKPICSFLLMLIFGFDLQSSTCHLSPNCRLHPQTLIQISAPSRLYRYSFS